MAAKKITEATLLLGRCIPCLKHDASKFEISHLVFDERLLMYFTEKTTIFAYDPKKICKTGDTALLKQLEDKKSTLFTHEVLEVLYKHGDVTCPVTGNKVEGLEYRNLRKLKDEMFGRNETDFDYEKAPPRGWQENKKDFSHRKTYRQYAKFKEPEYQDQPDAV